MGLYSLLILRFFFFVGEMNTPIDQLEGGRAVGRRKCGRLSRGAGPGPHIRRLEFAGGGCSHGGLAVASLAPATYYHTCLVFCSGRR